MYYNIITLTNINIFIIIYIILLSTASFFYNETFKTFQSLIVDLLSRKTNAYIPCLAYKTYKHFVIKNRELSPLRIAQCNLSSSKKLLS